MVDTVLREGRSPSELTKSHGLSRTWIYELINRFRADGYAALEPHGRRRNSARTSTDPRSKP